MSWGRESVCLLRWQIIYWRNNFFHFETPDKLFFSLYYNKIDLSRKGRGFSPSFIVYVLLFLNSYQAVIPLFEIEYVSVNSRILFEEEIAVFGIDEDVFNTDGVFDIVG